MTNSYTLMYLNIQVTPHLKCTVYYLHKIFTSMRGNSEYCSLHLYKLSFFISIQQTTSRTTGRNIGLFVLILVHFPCWFQIWTWNVATLTFLKILWNKWICHLVSTSSQEVLKFVFHTGGVRISTGILIFLVKRFFSVMG